MITILYTFDSNNEQFDFFKLSFFSLITNNSKNNINVYIINDCHKTMVKTKDYVRKINHKQIEVNYLIITDLIDNKKILSNDARFYWYFFPYVYNGNKFVLLDNDTIVDSDLNKTLNKEFRKLNNKVMLGKRDNWRGSSYRREFLSDCFFKEQKKFVRNPKYVNNGILLVNNVLWKKNIKTLGEMVSHVTNYIDGWFYYFDSKNFQISFIPEQELSYTLFRAKNLISNKLTGDLHWSIYGNYKKIVTRKQPKIIHYFIWNGHEKTSYFEWFNDSVTDAEFKDIIHKSLIHAKENQIKKKSLRFNERAMNIMINNVFEKQRSYKKAINNKLGNF